MTLVLQQIPIRLQLSTASAPPVAPIDYNTGLPPAAWRAQTVALAIGVFDQAGLSVDLTDLAYIQLLVQESSDSTNPLLIKQVDAADITKTITVGGWQAGTEQNAIFQLSAAELDLSLGAAKSRDFWLVVVGYTSGGNSPLILGGGPFTVYLASAALPATPARYVSRGAQATNAGDFTVTPRAQVHTELVTIGGSAREVSGILGTIGVLDGARLFLNVIESATPDIIVNLKSGVGTNPTIFTITTGTVLNGSIDLYFNADTGTWVVEKSVFPAIP